MKARRDATHRRPEQPQGSSGSAIHDAKSGTAPCRNSASLVPAYGLCVALLWATSSIAPALAEDDDAELDSRFAGGAPLKTDPELESQMRRAEKFAEDKEYGYAATVWQYVLDKSGDTLMTRDGRIYTSLSEEVERTLVKLPPEALRVYRITADGEAKAILAQNENEEEALAEVVRRYFVSSYGDDAAYKLGCLALDRHDFVGASRMFNKILELHPDPSIPRTNILLRLAVASARVGDKDEAPKIIARAEEEIGSGGAAAELLAAVKRSVQQSGRGGPVSDSDGQWLMALGGPARRGHMRALPATVMQSDLTELWGFSFSAELSLESSGQVFSGGYVVPGGDIGGLSGTVVYSGRVVPAASTGSTGHQLTRWRGEGWRPAGQMLVTDTEVLFKTNNDLTAWNAREIGLRPESEQNPAWRSAWLNEFQLDSYSRLLMQMGIQQQVQHRPVLPADVMLFGDRVHQSMSLAGGVVYSVEGRRAPRYGGSSTTTVQPRQGYPYGVMPRRSRRNWLAAYDAQSGKAIWYRGASDSAEEDTGEQNGSVQNAGQNGAEMGFLSAPVPYGRLLLAPVSDGGTIWLYALSRADGSTVWKSYLCDEPTGGCSPWSPACVAVDGRDAYVVCGTGVVFALDAVSGDIRYAVRYERHGRQSQVMRNYGYGNSTMLELNGWEEDAVIPYGRALVVMGSDNDRLFAIDRRTGALLWDSPRTPFNYPAEYCLGVVDGALFVGGKNVVRRYDIATGLLKWETSFHDPEEPGGPAQDSCGRGALTEDAIYMPVQNSVWKLDLSSGQVVKRVGVSLTTEDPVGNLYSDGERLWVMGGNRVYALTNLEHRLAVLEKRIAQGDATALLDRMKLWGKSGEWTKAVADLEAAHEQVVKREGATAAAAALVSVMVEIHLPDEAPREALRVVRERLARLNDLDADAAKEILARRRRVLALALARLRSEKTAGIADILASADQFDDDNLQDLARQALKACAAKDDVPRLREALAGSDPVQRLIAADALAMTAGSGSDALQPVRALLDEKDERLKLAGARALANLGDRATVDVLLTLMDSEQLPVRTGAARVLRSLTGKSFGYAQYDKQEARREAIKRWRDWLDSEEGKSAELAFPLPETAPLLGRTLIASYAQGVLVEFDPAGKEVWRRSLQYAWSVKGLPDGHRLASVYAQNKVVEFDEKGNEVWSKAGLPGNAFSARRLENGNTLIACSNGGSGQVVEVEREKGGEIVWRANVQNRPVDAVRLENGNTLVCCANVRPGNTGSVVEIDGTGKIVWELPNMNGPFKAQRLENGNTLIAQMNGGRVVEVDRDKKVIWEHSGLNQPYDVQRLPNGNTLVGDSQGAHEFSPDHKQVWSYQMPNVSGVSRY